MEKMNIVVCTDKWYVMPTGVMMLSVCQNNPNVEILFHIIIDNSVTAKDQQDLEDVISKFIGKDVWFYDAKTYIMNIFFPAGSNRYDITNVTYFRLYLTEILPKTIDKVLYLDGDVIVRHSLLPLYNTDIENYSIAAVPDMSEGMLEIYNRLKYPPNFGYFNAGVLLINLKLWRINSALKDFLDYMQYHKDDIVSHDQDVLNVIFHEKKTNLHLTYNLTNGFLWENPQFRMSKYEETLHEALKDPVIIHYTVDKPWHSYQRTPHPFANTWYKYQDYTIWKGVKCDRRPIKLRLKNYVADILRKRKLISSISIHKYIEVAPVD